MIIKAVWPFWDGNEVWLIAGAGALFAAFPLAYASIFSGFYLFFMIVLFALILRAVSLEFYYYDESRKHIWASAFAIGSFIPPLLLGIILGNIVMGVPLTESHRYAGSISMLFRPLPVLTGILAVIIMLIHGGLYLSIKTGTEIQQKAKRASNSLWSLLLPVFIIAVISAYFFIYGSAAKVFFWISSILSFIFILLLKVSIKTGKDIRSFILSSLTLLGLWSGVGSLLYPDLLRGLYNVNNITIFNASSSQRTLTIMLIVAVIGMPIVIGYTIYVYRVFRGRINE
jgi:cytochrome d ubiquinol oxidase subunit II